MKINGKDYKVNLLMLSMESEVDSTLNTVETLLETVENDVIISVLLNGGKNPRLKQLLSSVDCINYYECEDNLGVAGGRNFLLNTDECKSSDIVMILDNDVVPPQDYIKSLATFLVKQKDAGVVGAAAADVSYFPYELIKYYGERGRFKNRIFKLKNSYIKLNVMKDLREERLFHIGVHPNYYFAYFSIWPRIYLILSTVFILFRIRMAAFSPVLRANRRYLEFIKNGTDKYSVSNVAGCSQAFRRRLVDEIGYLDEVFNPYGYEDVDFCIRSIKAGYKNYIDTNTWLYHGTDARHGERDPDKALENNFRGLTLLAWSVLNNPIRHKFTLFKMIMIDSLFDLLREPRHTVKRIKLRCSGFQKGIKSINEKRRKVPESRINQRRDVIARG